MYTSYDKIFRSIENSFLDLLIRGGYVWTDKKTQIKYQIKYYTDNEIALQPLNSNCYIFRKRAVVTNEFK